MPGQDYNKRHNLCRKMLARLRQQQLLESAASQLRFDLRVGMSAVEALSARTPEELSALRFAVREFYACYDKPSEFDFLLSKDSYIFEGRRFKLDREKWLLICLRRSVRRGRSYFGEYRKELWPNRALR